MTLRVPRYLSCPLNTAALAVASLLATPALLVAREASAPEADQAFLARYLSQEWGFEPTSAQALIQGWAGKGAAFDGVAYEQVFGGLVHRCPEMHRGHLRQEILGLRDRLPSGAGQSLAAQAFYLQLQNLLNRKEVMICSKSGQ